MMAFILINKEMIVPKSTKMTIDSKAAMIVKRTMIVCASSTFYLSAKLTVFMFLF